MINLFSVFQRSLRHGIPGHRMSIPNICMVSRGEWTRSLMIIISLEPISISKNPELQLLQAQAVVREKSYILTLILVRLITGHLFLSTFKDRTLLYMRHLVADLTFLSMISFLPYHSLDIPLKFEAKYLTRHHFDIPFCIKEGLFMKSLVKA